MNDINTLWDDYARLQLQISQRNRVDAKSWGLEAGLDYLLREWKEGQRTNKNLASEIERGIRRQRYQARLRSRYFDPHQVCDSEEQLQDRSRLRALMARNVGDDRRMLLAVGLGYKSSALAKVIGKEPTVVRKRIERLRKTLQNAEV